MWGLIRAIVTPVVQIVLIPWLASKVVVDQKRYDLIAGIAKEAAEEAVLRLPGTQVDDIIAEVIDQIRAGVPTTSEEVIYRAAAAAVRRAVREYRDEPAP